MSLLADPLTLLVLAIAVVLLGLAKGGLSGVGALATPLVALVLPPTMAAALLPAGQLQALEARMEELVPEYGLIGQMMALPGKPGKSGKKQKSRA